MMNVFSKFKLVFKLVGNNPAVDTEEDNLILSHFLMAWDNPSEIINSLLPLIDKGIIHGIEENFREVNNWKGYFISTENCFLEVKLGLRIIKELMLMKH